MSPKEKIVSVIAELEAEGMTVLSTVKPVNTFFGPVVDDIQFAKWSAGCRNLIRLLGTVAETWSVDFTPVNMQACSESFSQQMLGTLQAIRQAVENDLLQDIEALVYADTFDNLLEQADHLQGQGYWLAAGIMGRAVLEQHLRKWCDRANCVPAKAKPTIADFDSELYAAKHLNAIEHKHLIAMAGVGNDAAHAKGNITASDVERLLRDVRDFLNRHPLR